LQDKQPLGHVFKAWRSWLRVLLLPRLHLGDLLVLGRDDPLRQAPHLGILAILKLHLRHVDRALVVRQHAGDEILVDGLTAGPAETVGMAMPGCAGMAGVAGIDIPGMAGCWARAGPASRANPMAKAAALDIMESPFRN
jgi:hypothetical protein